MTALVDQTGRHTITVLGTVPTTMTSGGPGGGAYFDFAGNGKLAVTGNSSDFKYGTGPACVELSIYVQADRELSEASSGGGRRILDGGLSALSTSTLFLALIGQEALQYSVAAPWNNPAYTSSWIQLRYDFPGDGTCKSYVNGSLISSGSAWNITALTAETLVIAGWNPDDYKTKCKIAGIRITRASRGTSIFDLSKTGADDPYWANTVFLLNATLPAPTQGVTFTSMTDTTAWTTDSGASGKTVSGTISSALSAGQVVRVKFGTSSWVNATVSGTTWTAVDPTSHTASWTIQAQVLGSDGQTGPLTTQAVTLIVWPTLAITSMTLDSDTIGDWITFNGAAGRTVSGTLSSTAPAGAIVQLSSDGVSWTTGSITDLSWAATDPLAHTSSWTYQARLVSAEGLVSSAVSQEVYLTTPPADFSPQGTFTKCLDLIRRFCQRTGLPQPTYVIGNQDIQIAQLMGLLEESLEMLVRRPERGWQVLTREALFVTKNQEVQGSLSDIAPGMIWITDQTIFNRTTRLPMYGPLSPEERQLSKALQTAGPYYRYWIVEDQLHLYPVPPAGQLLAFEYVSTYAWVSGDTSKPRVYRDSPEEETDICVLPRDVVLADLRWRWKKEKGLEYAQDFESFELLFARATSNDGMRRDLSMEGTPSIVRPGILVPAGSWPITGK